MKYKAKENIYGWNYKIHAGQIYEIQTIQALQGEIYLKSDENSFTKQFGAGPISAAIFELFFKQI